MNEANTTGTALIVAAVLLFFGLGIAIMIIMDHKAKLPGGFRSDPFSIAGLRRDHPVEAFVTGAILLGIIVALLFSLLAALTGQIKWFQKPATPGLISRLSEERTAERLRHFHNLPAADRTAAGKKNVCFLCHGDYPHSKEPMVRTLLNMHTQFIGCLTCHADAQKIPENTLRFDWLNYSGIAVKGPPFGTDVDRHTGLLVDTDDWYSKIVAYAPQDGKEILLETTADDPEAREFAAIQAKLSDHDREAVKKKFHKSVGQKGRMCARCHGDEARAYLPLRKLGFSDRRVKDLTNLNIIGLVQKYREFYMPDLSRTEHLQQGAAPAANKPSAEGASHRDPQSWWSQTYDAPAPKKPGAR